MAVTKTTLSSPSSVQGMVEIGAAAGAIWELLRTSGPMPQAKLIKDLGLPRDLALKGIGWLAREDKLSITGTRTVTLSLREEV